MPRLLVTGARTWTDAHLMLLGLRSAIVSLGVAPPEIVLVNGDAEGTSGAEGADRMSSRIGKALGMQLNLHIADWPSCVLDCPPNHRRVNHRMQEYCPDAGFRRNAEMIETLESGDLVLAYALRWGSGSGNCARQARSAGLTVVDWGVDTEWDARPARRVW